MRKNGLIFTIILILAALLLNNIGFAAADTDVPIILTSSISDNATNVSATKPIIINFSEAMDPATLNTSSITLVTDDGTNQTVDTCITVSADEKSVSITPKTAMTNDTPYLLTIYGTVTDLTGNPMSQDFLFHFTTSATVALSIISQGSSSAPYVVSGDSYPNILIDSSYVLFDGPVVTGSLTLKNGSVLSHSGATTTTMYMLDVTAASVNIDTTSKIDVTGKGYLGGYQGGNNSTTGMTYGNTTVGGSTIYNGGSYGGIGAASSYGGSVNVVYGYMKQPGEPGSGGGGDSTFPGGNGGGLIRLTTNTLTLDGSVIADGGSIPANYGSGAGSGGGILLNVGTLSGSGIISAKGGFTTYNTNYFGAGGGGRIAVYYNTNTLPLANITATGGVSGNGSVATRNGGVGTIYLKDNAKFNGDVVINNTNIATSTSTPIPGGNYEQFSLTGAVISVNADITISRDLTLDGSSVTVMAPVDVTGNLTLKNGSVLSHNGATSTTTYMLDVTAASVNIDATSKIDVTGKGYLGSYQAGNNSTTGMTYGNTIIGGSTTYNGGSYGGMGGMSSYGGNVNAVYGDMKQLGEVGSGGGGGGSTFPGGNGGGLIKLITNNLTLDGSIIADGGSIPTNYGSGAGSGGSILLHIGVLSGSGIISAKGGTTTYGTNFAAGGGGRIAVYYNTNTFPLTNITAAGGVSGSGSNTTRNGGDGTVYLLQNLFPLTVTQGGSGSGTVIGSPAGISCGSSCTGYFDNGTNVTLTAYPDPNSAFAGWSGACSGTADCTLTMDSPKSVTATFAKISSLLTVIFAGNGVGTVTSSPAGIACNTDCSASFPYGTQVTLYSSPSGGSIFGGWSNGPCSGIGNCQLTLYPDTSVTGTFTVSNYDIVNIGGNYYSTIQAAYNAAANENIIKLLGGRTYSESLVCNRQVTVTLSGGYDSGYSLITGYTTLSGMLTISQGTVITDGFIIQ